MCCITVCLVIAYVSLCGARKQIQIKKHLLSEVHTAIHHLAHFPAAYPGQGRRGNGTAQQTRGCFQNEKVFAAEFQTSKGFYPQRKLEENRPGWLNVGVIS